MMIKIIAITNMCLMIACVWLMTRYLLKHSCTIYDDYMDNKGSFKGLLRVMKRNANFIATYVLRLALAGIFLNNLSKLNTGYLYFTPDYQFYIANVFYTAFVIKQFIAYKRENKMERIIEQLQETIKELRK